MPSASAPSQLSRRGHPKNHCGAKTRRGTKCSKEAGFGTDHVGYGHCKHHGGSTPNGEIHAAKLHAAALALDYQVEPHEALLRAVGQAAKWELVCRLRVGALEDVPREGDAGAADALIVGDLRVRQHEGATTLDRSNRVDLNVWVKAHIQAVRDLASIAKTAIDAGVEERRVRIAEQLGSEIGDLFAAVFAQLKLTDDQQKRAPAIVRTQLELLEGGAQAELTA